MSAQHAPAPDYSLHEHVTWTIRACADCGDICLTTGEDRCLTCLDVHRDELETCKRVLRQRLGAVLSDAFASFRARSGGMNDPRELLCDECGEVAFTYTGSIDPLDGTQGQCESCGCKGRIDVDQDDEGHATVRFVRLRGADLDAAAEAGEVCKECLEAGGLDDDGICNECNEHAERREMGW